jgi:hypothetical protein
MRRNRARPLVIEAALLAAALAAFYLLLITGLLADAARWLGDFIGQRFVWP